MADWKQALDAIVADSTDELVALRRQMHAHPEPSGAELETSLLLYQRLADAGLEVRMGPDGCGVVTDNPAAGDQMRIAIRGDIDALLIQDEKQVPYRSARDGVMHACGHDAHAAVTVGAAPALRRLETNGKAPWSLRWRALLQPSEETATGARRMIEAGALDGVRMIFALHVDPTRRVGEIGLRSGAFTAHCDALHIVVRGRGGHGARPHESRDPIAAVAQLISTLYQFVPRANDSLDATVLSFGRIAGGENPNVIPEQVEIGGTLRTLESAVRTQTIEQIHQVARGVAEVTGTQIAVDWCASVPSVHNDVEATRLVGEAATDVTGGCVVRHIPRPSMGSEDFACFLEHCPGAMFRLGVARDLKAITPLHTPTFDVDESALALGAKLLARTVVLACEPALGATGALFALASAAKSFAEVREMTVLEFRSNRRPTLGIEIELGLVDVQSMDLVSKFDKLVERLPDQGGDRFKPEIIQSVLEINTDVCETVKDAEKELRGRLGVVEQAADSVGVALWWGGVHPFALRRDQTVTSDERYLRLVDQLQVLARNMVTFGLHVHVGVDSGDKAVMICDRILRHLPTLLALSSSSPYWEGQPTGLQSFRSKIMELLPTAGLPPLMRNWSEYVWLVNHMVNTGFIETIRELWWDVRPHHNFGTVEVRMCDMPGNLDDTLALAALIQCLVKALSDDIDQGAYQHDCHPMMVRQNKWRAARFGGGAQLVDAFTYQVQSLQQVVDGLVSKLLPVAVELGCAEYLQRCREMAAGPTWADRQLALAEETGSLPEVVRQLTRQSRTTPSTNH